MVIGNSFDSLTEAMGNFGLMTHTEQFPVMEAVHLIQQMISVGLPIEETKVEEDMKKTLRMVVTLGGLLRPPDGFLEALGLSDDVN